MGTPMLLRNPFHVTDGISKIGSSSYMYELYVSIQFFLKYTLKKKKKKP